MKRKSVLMVVALMLIVIMMASACAPSVDSSPAEPEKAEETVTEEETEAVEAADYKVAVLTVRKLTTPADLDTMKGIIRLQEELGIECKIIECTEIAEYKEQMQAVCEEGYNTVYFIYDNFLESAKELAPIYPDINFIGLWIDLPKGDEMANVKPLFFRPEQGSFMCGVVAALMTETNKVAFMGGGINPGIITFLAGFEAGINYVDNGTELVVSWANTFEDPLKGKELASSLYARDVDIIFQVANQTGLGVFEAAKESGKYAIGVDVDQSDLAPENIIASCLLDHGFATYDSISKAYNDEFTNEQVYYGLAEGMPVIALNSALVSDDIQAKIKEVEQEIADGKIEIPKTTETE
jgi:basic membrane protein A and related proteins